MSKLAQLRSAALPFVTRAHRGGRMRRFALLSLVLAIMTLILGAWISFGSGSFESEIRQGFDLEESRWQREQLEHVIIVDSELEYRMTRTELDELSRTRIATTYTDLVDDWSRSKSTYDEGVRLVRQAANNESPRPLRDLQGQAKAALEIYNIPITEPDPDTYYTYFSWHDRQQVDRLRRVLAADLLPTVELYESPLSFVDGVRLTGAIAGGFFSLLLLVVAPLLVGTQMAQEVHENTLMPLTGTSLRTHELILGIGAGPLSIVALLAIPQALLLLLTVAFAGHLVPALAGIFVAIVGCFFLSLLAQLIGYALGSQRTPGVLAMGMLGFFGTLAMIGAGIGLIPTRHTVGIFALLPEAATAHLIRSSLLPHEIFFNNYNGLAHEADFAIAVGTVGIGMLALLGLRALVRKVGRRSASALTRPEALLGAVVTMVLVVLANPARHDGYNATAAFFLLNIALMSIPFVILMMMRTPVTDLGEKRAPLPLMSLLGELFLWTGLLGALTLLVLDRSISIGRIHPVFVTYLVWYLAVLGMMAIRVVAMPMGLLARAGIALSALFTMLAFPQMAIWMKNSPDIDSLVLLGQVSPFLGAVQAALLVAIPVMLWRSLRRRS